MGLKLFDDNPIDDNEKLNQIEINKEFARRYEHNKKREDLQRLEELKKKGMISDDDNPDSDESSEEEEEEDFKSSKKKDLKFFDALIKVRNKDPVLKNKDANLFESEEEDDNKGEDGDSDEEEKDKGKVKQDGNNEKKKPMYLKDVVSKHLIEEGPEFEDSENDEDNNDKNMVGKKKVKSYLEEQEVLRKAFLEAVEEAEAGGQDVGELLKEKSKKDVEEDDDYGVGNKLDDYFGADEKLDADSMFLKDYFRNRLWMGEGGAMAEERFEMGFSDDENEIEKQEDYERDYNFRFEENAGHRVMGHSRVVEGSVRKKTNARKLQRERKEERNEQAEFERKEELKHLKNLKKKEMREKLQKIKEAAGIGDDGACLFDEEDLEEEFNSEEYDKKMKEAFDNEYYDADDIDPEFGSDREEDGEELEKPDFDKEDELLGLPRGWDDDVNRSGDGFLSTRQRILKLKAENGGSHEQIEQTEDEDAGHEDGKRKKKRKQRPSEVEKAVRDQLLEDYYKLDYEDTVGDLKTRFKYKAVNPKRYGLTTEEILMLDDKELNQYVPLKKLAPYKENEWKVPRFKTYQQKQRNKELLQEEASNLQKAHKKFKGVGDKQNSVMRNAESVKPRTNEVNDDTNNLSRKSKRRHRKAELKLPNSRLLAYGKIPSKAKKKMNS